MQPKELVFKWVNAFNNCDADLLSEFYSSSAINHHISESPIKGKEAIKEMFTKEFSRIKTNFIVQNIFENGEWAILEWKDPLDLQGCGFFQIQNGKIIYHRDYRWRSSQLPPCSKKNHC